MSFDPFGWFRRDRSQRADFVRPWGDRPALYDHIVSHVDAATQRLTQAGFDLPDEPKPSEDKFGWMPGAIDGVMGHHANGDQRTQRAEAIHRALKPAIDSRSPEALRELHALLSNGRALECVDALLERIVAARDLDAKRLFALAKWLALNAPERETVKFAMALLGVAHAKSGQAVLRTLALHDEFTVYAVVAMLRTAEEPERAVWDVARHVTGWGRVQAVERLKGTRDPEIKAWLLREGYRNDVMNEYTALVCAETGGLLDELRAETADDELIRGAGEILGALTLGVSGPAPGFNEYADGAEVVRVFLGHVARRAPTLADVIAVSSIREILDDENPDWTALPELGWTQELRATLRARCDALLDEPRSRAKVIAALEADVAADHAVATRAARVLGIDAWPYHVARIERRAELDAWSWSEMCLTDDRERFRRVLAIANERIALDRIATGPDTKLGLGPRFAEHALLGSVLQELRRFPSEGWELIRAGLASPVLSNRHMALRALDAWGKERWNSEVEPTLRAAAQREPDKDVEQRIDDVLAGTRIDPTSTQRG